MLADIVPGAKFPDYELTGTNNEQRMEADLKMATAIFIPQWRPPAARDAVAQTARAIARAGRE